MHFRAALKILALAFAGFVIFHWLTAGHDQIIEGPPETFDFSVEHN